MKTMTLLFLFAAALVVSEVRAVPLHVTRQSSQQSISVDRVRLVCDQNCRCWHTRYQQRDDRRKADDWERQDPNYCPGGGYYNGHYRTGPGTGLSFDSRFPVRSLPFPF